MLSDFFPISPFETKFVEVKEKFSKSLLKAVSAFANFHDGKIVIGITDNGNVVGVEDIKQLRLNIENSINDNINPRPYYEFETNVFSGHELLIISIYKGDYTPYLYDKKAYQRYDTSSVEVDKFIYDELVLLGRNLTYEELPYAGKNLKFEILEKRLQDTLNIREVDENILKSLELYKNDSFINASALLADNNKFNEIGLDLICYQDNSMLEIKDRVHLSKVSIISHYEQCMAFYNKHINKKDIIKSEKRITYEEIPLVAYREAIVNAIIHRDYSKAGNNRIEFFEDRIEIVSIGGLPIGISEEEFINGSFTHARNKIIMDIFSRMNLVEKLGTGIRRIKNIYMIYNVKPVFEIMKNSIKMVLPKIDLSDGQSSANQFSSSIILTAEDEKLTNYIKSCGSVNRVDIEKYMSVKKTKATILLKNLLKKRIILKIGTGKSLQYKINNNLLL